MKLSFATLFLSLTSGVTASKVISGKAAAKVLRAARKLEQQGDDAQQNEFSYLAQYNVKMIGCKKGQQVVDAETGEYEYSAAIFRLCPNDGGCNSDSLNGCTEGYGDYMVGLNTFVDAFLEDQRDNMQYDDAVQIDRYSECGMYEMEQDDDANAAQVYYVGPTCTDDELDVKMAVFDDETCTTASSTSFSTISNGMSLPYASGGMVSTYCQDCVEKNDNGEYELKELCMQLRENAAYACEQKMEVFSPYGQNNEGCEIVTESLPRAVVKEARKSGGKIFGWIVFAFVIIGMGGYVMWWRKKKQAAAQMSS